MECETYDTTIPYVVVPDSKSKVLPPTSPRVASAAVFVVETGVRSNKLLGFVTKANDIVSPASASVPVMLIANVPVTSSFSLKGMVCILVGAEMTGVSSGMSVT